MQGRSALRLFLAYLLAVPYACTGEELAEAVPKKRRLPAALAPNAVSVRLQRAFSSVKPPDNTVGVEGYRDAAKQAVFEAATGLRVKYSADVERVTWKDGVATLQLAKIQQKAGRTSKRTRFTLMRTSSIKVSLDMERSSAIKRGQTVRVDAIVFAREQKMFAKQPGAVLFRTLNSPSALGVTSIELATTDYRVFVNGEEMEPSYALPDGVLSDRRRL